MTDLAKVLEHFKRKDKRLYRVAKEVDYERWLEGVRTKPTSDYIFFRLCRSVIGQQLSGKASATIAGRLEKLLPKGVYEPKAVLKLKDEDMRQAGMSWAKAKYVKNIAQAFVDEALNSGKLHKLDNDEVISTLVAIKGIGPWTAEMFLMFTLGREDLFSHGDLGLKRGIEKVYGLSDPSRDEIEKIVSAWSPYKTFGSISMWHALE